MKNYRIHFRFALAMVGAFSPCMSSSLAATTKQTVSAMNSIQLANAENPDLCVKYKTEARFSSGYDHWIHIKNSCSAAVTCKVSTNVNEKIKRVQLASAQRKSVLTFRGSPARTFQASVKCVISDQAKRRKKVDKPDNE